MIRRVRRRARALRENHLRELDDLLRIPSVSGQPARRADVQRAARWMADRLERAGLDTAVHATQGHPIVTGAWCGAEGAPTLLFYGHYDVQPPEPLSAWTTPPFEPTVRYGRLFARGAVDDKGQLYTHVAAVDAWLQETGTLPVNVRFLIEGEEEVASPNLLTFVRERRVDLACDGVVISDTTMVDASTPTLGVSLRGGVKLDVTVRTAGTDLHSGLFGGVAPNAAAVLVHMLASLHDVPGGRVAVPGFYDGIDVDPVLAAALSDAPIDAEALARSAGVREWGGEPGRSFAERRWLRPTLEVNGMVSGYTGDGPKSVIPADARAKISCRLVPGQDPDTVAEEVRSHLLAVAPERVDVAVTVWPGTARPWVGDPGSPLARAGRAALAAAFGSEPVLIGEGGSIPIVPGLEEELSAPVLLLGFGLPESNAHAPDEWLDLDLFDAGVTTVIELLQRFREAGHADRGSPRIAGRGATGSS